MVSYRVFSQMVDRMFDRMFDRMVDRMVDRTFDRTFDRMFRAEADGFFSTISDDELHVMSVACDALYRNAPVRRLGR